MPQLAPGATFAGYRIRELAGRGGMGVVYSAVELALDRTVALKLMTAELAGDEEFRRRFVRESKVAASLDHPNVIPIFSAGEHDGVLFLAMRYVNGRDLRSLIVEHGRLSPERAAGIVAQVASALDSAHEAGLVHRDVKPANVLVTSGDHVYLTDFGLTKQQARDDENTRTGRMLGTFNYVAPEQIRGGAVGPHTDVYALGCMLYLLLTGQVPFPLDTEEAKLWAHMAEPAPDPSAACPDVPPAFDEVVQRAMSKAPEDRFPTAGDLGGAAMAATIPAPGAARRRRASSPSVTASPARAGAIDRKALVGRALRDPFALVVLAVVLVAGLMMGAILPVVPVALVLYAASVTLAYRDKDRQQGVTATAASAAAPPPPRAASSIDAMIEQALEKQALVLEDLDKTEGMPAEVARELDALEGTVRRTAEQARVVEGDLKDLAAGAAAQRHELLEATQDSSNERLRVALQRRLDVQGKLEDQMRRYFTEMQEVLAELDSMRADLTTPHEEEGAAHAERLAAEVRDLRKELGDVGDDLAEGEAHERARRVLNEDVPVRPDLD
jgi:hypothetical protein